MCSLGAGWDRWHDTYQHTHVAFELVLLVSAPPAAVLELVLLVCTPAAVLDVLVLVFTPAVLDVLVLLPGGMYRSHRY